MASTARKKAGVMFSGGKDSTYACARILEGGYDIACLITIVSSNRESYMLHTPNVETANLSATAMELPIFVGTTEGQKEKELADIKEAILSAKHQYSFDHLVTGAIASRYQKERIDRIARELYLLPVAPLWEVDQVAYLRELEESAFRFIITSVSTEGLDDTWLGKEITPSEAELLIKLSSRYGFNPAFEGGEAETLVIDCPLFKKYQIKIVDAVKRWNGYYGMYEIRKAILQAKMKLDRVAVL